MKKILCIFFCIFLILSCCLSVGASSDVAGPQEYVLSDLPPGYIPDITDTDFIYNETDNHIMLNGSVPSIHCSNVITCDKEVFNGYPLQKLKEQFGADLPILDDKFYIIVCRFYNSYYCLELLISDSYSMAFGSFQITFTGNNAEKYVYKSNERQWYLATPENDYNPYSIYRLDHFYYKYYQSATYHLDTRKAVILYSNYYLEELNKYGMFSTSSSQVNPCYGVFPLPNTVEPLPDSSDFGFISYDDFMELEDIESPFHLNLDEDNWLYPLANWFNYVLDFIYKTYTYVNVLCFQFISFLSKLLKGEIPLGEAVKIFFQGLFDNLSGVIEQLKQYIVIALSGLVTLVDLRLLLDDILINFLSSLKDTLEFLFVPTNFSASDWFDILKEDLITNFTFVNRIRTIFDSFSSAEPLSFEASFMGYSFTVNGSLFSELRVFVRNGLKCIFAVCTLLALFRMISSAFGVTVGSLLVSSDSGSSDKSKE